MDANPIKPPTVEVKRYTRRLDGEVMEYPAEIAGMTVDLEIPQNFVLVDDVCTAGLSAFRHEQTARRACAAALMLCWPLAYKRAGTPKYQDDIMVYSRVVIEYLHSLGAKMDDVVRAGQVAIRMCLDSQLTADDIARARGKSKTETTPEPSGSGSASDASGSRTFPQEG